MTVRSEQLFLRPSPRLFGLVVLIALLAAVSIEICLDGALAVVLIFGILTFTIHIIRRYVFLNHLKSIKKLVWRQGAFQVVLLNDLVLDVEPSPCSVLGSSYTLLCFRSCATGRNLLVPIFSDGADTEDLRRLRVYLKCGAGIDTSVDHR
ncbi:hypothetical protein BGP75_07540 [Motiliproteus sp. MSK22-1]|nr:hypothetical protein BGP75_07540 [Motiliproteus sp. MSK22-1]